VLIDRSDARQYVVNLKRCMQEVPSLEFIVQCNHETDVLWKQMVEDAPTNMSILYDASCGTGVRVSSFPAPSLHPHIPCGYAGGIGKLLYTTVRTDDELITKTRLYVKVLL